MRKKLEKVILTLLSISLLLAFLSKGVFNISSLLLVIFLGIKAFEEREKINKKEKGFIILLLSTIIGLFSSFSNQGLEGIISFIGEERFLLYLTMFYVVFLNKTLYKKSEQWFLVGGILSVIQSFLGHYKPTLAKKIYPNMAIVHGRMGSFQNNIRWGQFLSIFISNLFDKLFSRNAKVRIIFMFILFLFVLNLPINGGRAAMLSSFIGGCIMIILLFTTKTIKLSKKVAFQIFIISGAIIMIIFTNNNFLMRIKSISNMETNKSNVIRLNFMKFGKEIIFDRPLLGYGPKKSTEVFYEYINLKDENFKKEYFYPYTYGQEANKTYMGTPFENNYINMAVNYGLLFVLMFNFFFLWIIVEFLLKLREIEKGEDKIRIIVIISIIIASKSYEFFFPGTDNYSYFFLAYFIGYGRSIIVRKER